MTHAAFEQLMLAWLAEPDRADLQAQLAAATASCPEYAAELAQWRRSEALLRDALPALPAVDWSRFAARVSSAVDESMAARAADDEALDRALRDSSGWADQVDWSLVASRISHAVTVGTRQAAPRRRRYARMIAGAGTLLAAAAALVVALLPRPVAVPTGTHVDIRGPAAMSVPSGGVAVVKISRMEAAEAQPQRLFIVDPVMAPTTSDDSTGYY
jgi:hypothetical protein